MTQVSEKQFYTYVHTRNDTGAVFYVGKGHGRRAHASDSRNPYWRNIVSKHGRTVHMAAQWRTEAEAFEHEKFLILCFNDLGVPLCNMTLGGDGGVPTAEVRAKISAKHKGRVISDAWRANMSRGRVGLTLSAQHKASIGAAGKGRIVSDETKEKMRATWAIKFPKPLQKEKAKRVTSEATKAKLREANVGKKLSDDHKAKIGRAHAGKIIDGDMRERISKALKGRKIPPEAVANMVASLTGRVPSEATREKLRLAALAQWKRKREE